VANYVGTREPGARHRSEPVRKKIWNAESFFKQSAGVIGVAAMVPKVGESAAPTSAGGERLADRWTQMGTGTTGLPVRKKTLQFDVAVIGAGMAGICAAVAAARNGARTVLINDRPVLGGNASSEIRVTVNGVTHLKPNGIPERETGIIEEILLDNRFFNPQESYPVWDHIVYDYVTQRLSGCRSDVTELNWRKRCANLLVSRHA
jgi:hypothetical protein